MFNDLDEKVRVYPRSLLDYRIAQDSWKTLTKLKNCNETSTILISPGGGFYQDFWSRTSTLQTGIMNHLLAVGERVMTFVRAFVLQSLKYNTVLGMNLTQSFLLL